MLERRETPLDPLRALRQHAQDRRSSGDLPGGVPEFDLGTAAALSVMVLVILLVINVAQLRFLRRGAEE